MESKLIILRGNSGSGKTTIAKCLQNHLGHGTLLVSQDVVRRDMLKVHDRDGNLSIDLIRQIAEYGKGKCEFVIVEGILNKSRYGEMLKDLIKFYNQEAYTYYFDLTFEETVIRHNSRAKKMEFGEDSLRAWWNSNDYLEVQGETLFTNDMSQNDVLKQILNQLQK
ncbi:kinase [Anaerobacillus isosaccharinicus]|uniref:Kinase n=1 Tax=Anaerobacillus isosaccharinicus TaxID=1532552 RepID=A0A7S7LC06_9BACI|nr:kinase [Anaerobacillus isosaccharinicus]MBA5588464.1 kinase [Anaerobacillus isosaccharinicus]QOY38110.1 kinase [Anaerobacillus isosaccharinicus]